MKYWVQLKETLTTKRFHWSYLDFVGVWILLKIGEDLEHWLWPWRG